MMQDVMNSAVILTSPQQSIVSTTILSAVQGKRKFRGEASQAVVE